MGRIYVVGDTVFVSPTPHADLGHHVLGSFSNFVKSYADQAARIPNLCHESPHLVKAHGIASQLYAIRFCLTELLDALQSGQSHSPKSLTASPGIDRLLAKLTRSVKSFQQQSPRTTFISSIACEFRDQFQPPCAVLDGQVVPLTEVSSSAHRGERVRVGEQYFRLRHKRAKTLQSAIGAIRERVTTDNQANSSCLSDVTASADRVTTDATQLFSSCPSTDQGPYRVMFEDDFHQLQHNHLGDFMLVRGPVQHRLVEEELCVGLSIYGKSRQQILAISPTVAPGRGEFWTPEGRPFLNPVCMGSPKQYHHLRSQQFTDAEAVVQWLDAGVIVATSRPEYHQMCTGESPDLHRARRQILLRGGRRHG